MTVTIYLQYTSIVKRIFPNHNICTLHPCPFYGILYVILLWSVYMDLLAMQVFVQFMLLEGPTKKTSLGIMLQQLDDEKSYLRYIQRKVGQDVNMCACHYCKLPKYGRNIEGFCKMMLILRMSMRFGSSVNTSYNDNCDAFINVVIMILMFTILMQLEVFAVQVKESRDQGTGKQAGVVFSCSLPALIIFLVMKAEDDFPIGITKITPRGFFSNTPLMSPVNGKRS